jgi:hypothetical protein
MSVYSALGRIRQPLLALEPLDMRMPRHLATTFQRLASSASRVLNLQFSKNMILLKTNAAKLRYIVCNLKVR